MALTYRAHFAFANANLRNAEGLNTGPVFGFANTLIRLMDTERPTHLVVAWDTHAPTFRHALDPLYKAHRPPQPEEISEAIPRIKEMLGLMRIPSVEQDGVEADDILGTLAWRHRDQDIDVFMVTPDKDYMQLVSGNICQLKPRQKEEGFDRVDRDGVIAYFGVPPEQVVDVLTLIGDTSDNVPGVPGIGKKGAPELILEYGSLEALVAAAPDIKAKRVREGLTADPDRIRLSKQLVTIKTDVDGLQPLEGYAWAGVDAPAVAAFFGRMGFKTLTRRFTEVARGSSAPASDTGGQPDLFSNPVQAGTEPASPWATLETVETDFELVDTREAAEALVRGLTDATVLCFDTETTGIDPLQAEWLGLALSAGGPKAWYAALPAAEMADIFAPLFGASDRLYVGHNVKYDWVILTRHGIRPAGRLFDTMIAAGLVDPGQSLGMDALSRRYLAYDPIPIERLIGSGKQQKSMKDVPVADVAAYAAEDAWVTFRLYETLSALLETDDLTGIARDIEFPLVPVLADMERWGVRLDLDRLAVFSKELGDAMIALEAKIFELAGTPFNLNSPAQLGDILFKRMGIPSGKKTATGQYSTSEDVLQALAGRFELPALILEYRMLSKLKSTYVDALPRQVSPVDGRIHTSYNQAVAATGRLASSNPNLQNIPIRTEKGREIRKAFIAAPGFKLLSADYSQIELRVIAAISADENMKAAFIRDEDIHATTARALFNLPADADVDRESRRKAKEVNFGIPYGVSAFGLAGRLDISNSEGKAIIDAYFDRFPKIKAYMDDTVVFARENGYVKTLGGRRRYIRDIHAANVNARQFAERTAINTPIQGSAADLIKLAMIRLDHRLRSEGLSSRMLLQVHDELVFEVAESESDRMMAIVKEEMESAMDIGVPLKAEMGVADNWLDAH
jgi:DNA polymerase-1